MPFLCANRPSFNPNRSAQTVLASLMTTAILLLPAEYEAPIRSVMLFLSSRRF